MFTVEKQQNQIYVIDNINMKSCNPQTLLTPRTDLQKIMQLKIKRTHEFTSPSNLNLLIID